MKRSINNFGPKWKKLKQESGKLVPGSKGILISCSITGKHKDAMQEILYILRQHSERFHPDASICSRNVDHVDKEMLLKSELENLNQEFNRFVPGPCISKGLDYVYFKKIEDTPSKYVSEIFKEIKNNKSYSARFLSRIVPVDYICEAKEEDLRCTLRSLISKEFPLSLANSCKETKLKEPSTKEDKINNESENKENYNSRKGDEESDNVESNVTWALEFKRTNSNALGREQVLDIVNELMGKEYKVDLKKPEKLIIVYVIKNNGLEIPEDGEWVICGDSGEDSKWYTHESQKWMYNSEEHVYFHIESQTIIPDLKYFETKNEENHLDEDYLDEDVQYVDENVEYPDEVGDSNQIESDLENDSEDFSMDFNKDLIAGTESRKGNLETKIENEDRFITRECMSIQYLTDSKALCYFSGVFDGHYGPKCSDYIVKHLKNNILTVFLQNIQCSSSFKKRKLFSTGNMNFSINEFPSNTNETLDEDEQEDVIEDNSNANKGLNELSDEVNVFLYSISKGVQMVDNNFCSYARKEFILDGSTLNLAFFYGPDSFGSLKLILANLGDSRSILCVKEGDKYVAKDLTREHKPDDKLEKERILKNNGFVEHVQGCWRAVLRKGNRIVCAISTSRALGDFILKSPNNIISSQVDLYVHDVDFDNFIFLVQCTDGITDVLTSQEIVDFVMSCINSGYDPKKAAKILVDKAESLGSMDDKTCNIIYFGWQKEVFSKLNSDEEENEVKPQELKQEEEDIF
uniref:Protein phosphatase 2C, putative n=1 Tax=Theileria annulata TaxID=5874 RepID=A0A3B0NA21_THEAN